MRLAPFVVALVLGSLPAYAAGQGERQESGQSCDMQPVSSSTRGTTLRDEGRTFMGGGVFFVCEGGTTIRSDSVASFEAAGMIEFFGRVHYADTVKTLSAEYVRYIDRIGQIIAQDSVVLSDIATGSQIRAPYLEYFQATETRPEALVRIPSGRPRAILVSRSGSSSERGESGSGVAEPADPALRDAAEIADVEPTDTTLIDADAMDFYGERLSVARGNVVVLREDMQAFGEEAHFDQSADSMLITGTARVVSDDYRLHGDTIAALITPERELRQVNAWHEAKLESDDLEAEAPGLRILLENGAVHRMIAFGERTASRGGPGLAPTYEPEALEQLADSLEALAQQAVPEREVVGSPPGRLDPRSANAALGATGGGEEGLEPGVQARVTSKDVRMIGDSIDALAPGQQIERVIAVGAAFGERITTDTTVLRPAIAENDWMTGDTIIATFAAAPDTAAPDTTFLEEETLAATVTSDPAVPDTTAAATAASNTAGRGAERVLESLLALGGSTDARSLYAVANDEDPLAPPALSYLIAQRIHVTMRDGQVLDVNAVGRDGRQVHGLYLEPADSVRARRASRSEREP